MNDELRGVTTLLPVDFERHPIWEFALDYEIESDTLMRPVWRLPADELGNRIVGTKVRLTNGVIKWATLGNIDLRDIERTEHFRSVSRYENGNWFHLARYHDPDLDLDRGQAQTSPHEIPSHEIGSPVGPEN